MLGSVCLCVRVHAGVHVECDGDRDDERRGRNNAVSRCENGAKNGIVKKAIKRTLLLGQFDTKDTSAVPLLRLSIQVFLFFSSFKFISSIITNIEYYTG